MEASKNPNPSETKLHFLDYWRIIRIRKTVILAVFLLVVLTTTAVTFILPKSYSSTVRIAVEKDTSDIPGLFERENPTMFDPYWVQTQFEIIQSKSVLTNVVNALKLNEVWAKRIGEEGMSISQAYLMLRRMIDVHQVRNTSLIEIRVYSEDKYESADIANEIAIAYKKNRLQQRKLWSETGIEQLRKKLKTQEDQVVKLQGEVDELRVKYSISDYIAEGGGPVTTLEPETVRMFEKERVSAEVEFTYFNTRLQALRSLSPSDLRKAILTANYDQNLTELMKNINDAEQRFTLVDKELGPEHLEVIKSAALLRTINEQIDARIQGILQGLETQVQALRARLTNRTTAVVQAKNEDVNKTQQYREYFTKKRILETEAKLLETMHYKLFQEEVDLELPKSSIVQITDPAEAGMRPVKPNIPLNIALGIIVGLVVGIGLAFFIEYLDTSVKTIDDVERALQSPVLGVIPQNVGSLLDEGPESPHAEAYRVLRTNVLFTRKDTKLNSITVVSGGAGEGKSTTIFNLATVFAQSGHRVLVVDSDLRRPSIHKVLNVSNSIGLTNYLLRQNNLEEVIQTTTLPGLDFMPSGKLPSSSMGILNSVPMKEFIAEAKKRYDFVFFDSPPIMGVSDASVLASEVDLTLLVIQYRKYPQAMTIRAKQMVEKVGGLLLGVVLNNINISQDSYYYYYSGYYYDYYSKQDEDEAAAKKNGRKKKALGERAQIDLKQKY